MSLKLSILLPVMISLCCAAAIVLHALYPNIKIDVVTFGFFIVGLLPWLRPLIKSVTFPGGWGVELQDYLRELDDTVEDATESGLLKPTLPTGDTLAATGTVGLNTKDQRLVALLKLRIEIESKLRNIALAFTAGGGFDAMPFGKVVSSLERAGILPKDQAASLRELMRLLNQAIHGEDLDAAAYEWAMKIGPSLLKAFDDM